MIKLLIIQSYDDRQFKRVVKKGEEIEVTEERAEKLLNGGVAEKVSKPKSEDKVEEKTSAKSKSKN